MTDRYDDRGARPASRGRGKSRARGSQYSGQSSARYSGGRSSSGNSVRRNDSYRGRRPERGGSDMGILLAAGIAFIVVVGGAIAVFSSGLFGGESKTEETVQATEAYAPGSITDDVYLDVSSFASGAGLINMKGMNREQVKAAIMASYNWNLVVTNSNPSMENFTMPNLSSDETEAETTASGETSEVNDNDGSEQTIDLASLYSGITIRPDANSFQVPDLIAEKLDEMIEQIFTDYETKKEQALETETESVKSSETSAAETSAPVADYALSLPDFSAQITDYMNQLATVWKMSPKNGDITSYDSSSGEFVFGGSVDGYEIDAFNTAEKVMKAINEHDYSASVAADGKTVSASLASIKDKYEIIGSFTTNTTANSIRNGNIKLAAAAINGTVLQPGEEFSFNETVGQRTAEKGYGGAPAYNEGEVVTEVGGGVCQVSSTLYNAVFRSGLTTTYRRSHTFAPTYVTPGTDATVSWPGPDYKFVNDSEHAIGILAWYENQTMNVKIYGIRVLPEGVSWELVSEKALDLPVPEPQLITEGEQSEGSAGSEWQAYKVIHKADGTTEKVKDHYTHYSGHTPKQYTPEIAASLAAESLAAAMTDENGETITAGTDETKESTETDSDKPGKPEKHEEDNEPDPEEDEIISTSAHSETNAETRGEISEGPTSIEAPGGSDIGDGLIGDGPVVGD